jgi:hypothetical protein
MRSRKSDVALRKAVKFPKGDDSRNGHIPTNRSDEMKVLQTEVLEALIHKTSPVIGLILGVYPLSCSHK